MTMVALFTLFAALSSSRGILQNILVKNTDPASSSRTQLFARSANKIIDMYVGSRPVVLFADEVVRSELGRQLLAGLAHPRLLVSHGNLSLANGLIVYLQDDRRRVDYAPVLGKLPLSDHSRHMILWDGRANLHHIQVIFESFWQYQLIDVAVMVPLQTGSVRVYAFNPYSESRCDQAGPPIMVNVWHAGFNVWVKKTPVFGLDNKLRDLHRCPLKCLGVHRPPVSTVVQTPTGWALTGSGLRIVRFLQQQMNFTGMVSVVHGRAGPNMATETPLAGDGVGSMVAEQVKSRKADLAFGRFTRMFDGESEVDFVREDQMDCFTWGLPSGIGRDPSTWLDYVVEFSPVTWLLIVGSVAVATVVVLVLSRESASMFCDRQSVFFYAFGTFIGVPVTKATGLSWPLQVFLSNWLLYSLVVTSAYQAYLGSLITIPQAEPEIDDQQSLLKTDLSLTGRQQMYYLINSSAGSGNDFRALVQRYHILPPEQFGHFVRRILTARDSAVLASRRELLYHAERYKRESNDTRRLHVLSTCAIESYSSTFLLRKGSPLRHRIAVIMSRLSETGIMQRWDRDNDVGESIAHGQAFADTTVLTMSQVYGPFFVLFFGHSLALCAFVGETVAFAVSGSKTKLGSVQFLH